MNTIETLLQKIEGAKELDFGTIFNESIELFKKTWLQGFLLQLFSLIVMIPLIIVLYAPMIGMLIAQQENGYTDPDSMDAFFGGMSVLYIVFVVVGIIVLGTITTALYAAFFRIMKKIDYNETVTTSDFFYFVKREYLSKIFLIMLVSIIIAIPAALLCYIPLIYAIVPLSYFAIFFAFNPELSVGDIVKLSFKLGNKKWLITFGLLFVGFICYFILSIMTCGLGGMFLKSFLYHPIYLIYKKIIGFDGPSTIDRIGTTTE